MPTPTVDNGEVMNDSLTRCRRLAKHLVAGRVTFEEYSYNATLAMVDAPDAFMPACVGIIPCDFVAPYMDYLRASLEPVDFMPCAQPFLAGEHPGDLIERKKMELRPKYLRLHRLVAERMAMAECTQD